MGKTALQSAVISILLLAAWCQPAWATPSGVVLTASPNPATLGQAVTLTATVTPSSATGKVAFYSSTNMLGVGILSNGVATLTTKLLPAGTGSLTAYYLGAGANASATSSAVSIAVSSFPQNGFQAGVSYNGGINPSAVALGDFNGDGKIDMAVANYSSGDVSVFFGNGNGTFQTPPATYAAGGNNAASSGIAVADFNGDGVLDLAVSNYNKNTISILLGNSNGTFQAATTVPTGSGPYVIAADFDGDGKADLAYTNQNDGTVSVRLGNGDGTFSAPHPPLTVGSFPASLATGNFNQDTKPDLVVANAGDGTVSVLLNTGGGSFAVSTPITTSSGGAPVGVAVADFDGDGNADIVAVNEGTDMVSVLLGKGDGTFKAAVNYSLGAGAGPNWVAAGDINGDGKLDLVIDNSGSPRISVFLGNGDGTFPATPTAYPDGSNPNVFALADLNGDGRSDLIIPDNSVVNVILGTPLFADMTVLSSHTGNFTQGQSTATYTITATNSGVARTTAAVTVVDKVPTGLVATGISGGGWSCALSTLTCTRSDALGSTASYPAITVTATVDNNAPAGTFNNVATVSGGGEIITSNDTSSDATTVAAASLLYSSSLAAAPSATANLPVTLSLASGTVTALNITVTIAPNNGAPILTSQPSFTKDPAQIQPGITNPTNSSITLNYPSVTLSGTVHLGDVAVGIPSTATHGQNYSVSITVNSSTPTAAVPGLSATLSAYSSYIIGDVYPATSTYAGSFGDGAIDTRDLLALLRVVTAAVPVPAKCTDVFDAMDVYPVAGGDGALDTRDLLQLLPRATNADPSRPTRVPRGASCTGASPLARIPEGNPEASLELETSDGLTAIYLRANQKLSLSGLALSVKGDDEVLGFAANGVGGPSVFDDGLPGTLSLAWLRSMDLKAGDRLLLGYVQSVMPGSLHFGGVSANATSNGRAVRVSFGAGSRRDR